MIATFVVLACILHGCFVHSATDGGCATLLERVNRTTFTNFLAQHHMAAVYFQKEGGLQICAFLNEMERSADELQQYGVAVRLNDCSNEATAVQEFCNTDGIHRSLYVFSYGQYLSHVAVGALFGKSAVLSNLLSLRLLKDVAVISSAKDRQQVEQGCAGKCILHGSFLGVGTPEHAAFMKVAHDYKDDARLKFIYGTHPDLMFEIGPTLGVSKERIMAANTEQALLIVTCYGAEGAGLSEPPAASHVYEGAMDYDSLASFVAALREPDVVDLGEAPNMSEVAETFLGRRHVLVAVYDQTVRLAVSEVVQQLTARYYKVVAAVVTNRDGAHRVSSFVNLTTAALTKVPLYCLASRQQLRCDCILTITDTDQAVQRLSSMIESCAKPVAALPLEASMTREPDHLPSHETDSVFKLIDAVETQDDHVAMHASHIRSSAEDWQDVPTLTRQNFTNFVQYPDGRLVLFHLKKFDSTSVVALHTLSETLRHLRGTHYNGTVAAVDCYDWTDVCTNASTYEYPALRIYRSGTSSGLLSVPVSTEGFATAARLATISNPVHLKTAAEISTFIADSVLLRKPSTGIAAKSFSPHAMIVIGALDSNTEAADFAGFVRASGRREGTSAFGIVFGDLATEFIARHVPAGRRAALLPAIAVWNVYRGELQATPLVYSGNASDAGEVERFLVRASMPAVAELTPAALPAIRAIGQPLVLLFTESEIDATVDVMKHVAVQQQEQQTQQEHLTASVYGSFIFAYMLRRAPGAEAILSHYWPGRRTSHQALVFVDLNQGVVYRYEGPAERHGIRADDVSAWLDGIRNGGSCPHAHLPAKRWLPAHPGYDFLAMVDSGFSLQQRDRLIRQRAAAGAAMDAADSTNQRPPATAAPFEKAAAASTGEHHTEL